MRRMHQAAGYHVAIQGIARLCAVVQSYDCATTRVMRCKMFPSHRYICDKMSWHDPAQPHRLRPDILVNYPVIGIVVADSRAINSLQVRPSNRK